MQLWPGRLETFSYEDLVKIISCELGLYPVHFKQLYKRSKVVFEKAKAEVLEFDARGRRMKSKGSD